MKQADDAATAAPLAAKPLPVDQLQPAQVESDSAATSTSTSTSTSTAPASSQYPSSHEPADNAIVAGQCWVYAQVKPRPVTSPVEITLKDSTTKLTVSAAELKKGLQTVVTREGTKTYRIEPPTYREVTERVLVRPEVTRLTVVPPVYEERQKTVVVEEARTTLEPCRTAGTRYAASTGVMAFCARETPAKVEVIKTQEMVTPETTRVEFEPAEYTTVTRWVLDQPARAVEVVLAPEVKTLPLQEVVTPEQTHQAVVPAVTTARNVTRFEGEAKIVSRQAVCDAEITPHLVKELQRYLVQRGYQAGRVDGLLGKQTIAALTEYQAANGLAVGALTFESLKHLGIE